MKVGFKNLRSLSDTGLVSIRPLTILLGQNSSGKSTFLRTFPLLKQSVEARTTGPLLWYGRFVDFGDFSNALSEGVEDKFIEFDFAFENEVYKRKTSIWARKNPLYKHLEEIKDYIVSLQLRGDKENRTYCSKISIQFNKFFVEIEVGKNDEIASIYIDGVPVKFPKSLAVNLGNTFIPRILVSEEDHLTFDAGRHYSKNILQILNKVNGRKLASSTLEKILDHLDLTSSEKLYDSLLSQSIVQGLSNKTSKWELTGKQFAEFKANLILGILPHVVDNCDHYIEELSRNISYIAPLRATAERYYRPQDLNVDEVDFQGKNLALFLRNLSSNERHEFENWCLETFDFYPKAKVSGGNLTVNVKFRHEEFEHNIADLGFGFSQILPIITQVWSGSLRNRHRSRKEKQTKLYAIEQPELHLHPKIQARLVNAIINVIKYCKDTDIQVFFVLETHSETIVNAVGTRVYNEQISQGDVNVLMFDKKLGKGKTKVTSVKYQKDGSLKNWPYGFFEEELEL